MSEQPARGGSMSGNRAMAAEFRTEVDHLRNLPEDDMAPVSVDLLRLAADALDSSVAENQRLREALEAFANPQHWGITRDGNEPVPTWIGTYRQPPTNLAREALAGDAE